MVTTKPSCWDECKTDSRYARKWPESLRFRRGMKTCIPDAVSIPFRNQRMAKCKRWLLACFGIFLLKNITEFPNPRIFSYSTTNKSSACSQEKGSKVKNVADNKDGEARSTETVLANYSTTMYQLTISSN